MSLVTVSDLTFAYDASAANIFEHVSFQFDTNWKLGFTGRNGRGKTTFLKLLTGEYEYGGTISSSVPFSYFPFDVGDPGRGTLDILSGINPGCEYWELCRELNLLQVPESILYRPFETASYGERTKTLIAALFLRRHNFLLLDEPTNHLDYLGRRAVADYLSAKSGFILVSHDRMLLDSVVDHTLSINRLNIEIQRGGFSQWLENKKRRDESEARQNRNLKRDISRLRIAARRTTEWSDKTEATKIGAHPFDRGAIGHKSAKMMKRAKSLESRQNSAIDEKSHLLRNVEIDEPLKIWPLEYHSDVLASFEELSIFYGGRRVICGVNLEARRGERIALQGGNGTGKSSLIKLLVGGDVPHEGLCKTGSGLVISYVPQDTSRLPGSLWEFSGGESFDRPLFFAILHKLGAERALLEKDMGQLSEGEKKKALVAKSLSERAHLYIWDEPLNYVDVQSRMQIEELIVKYRPAMLFAEHDETFVQNVATRKFTLG